MARNRKLIVGTWSVTTVFLSLLALYPKSGADRAAGFSDDHPAGRIFTVLEERLLPADIERDRVAFYAVAGLDVDPATGDIYLIDKARHLIFRLDRDRRRLRPFAGAQAGGFNGDGRPALGTHFHVPAALAVHRTTGDVYVADTQNHRIRVIPRSGAHVATIAGVGVKGLASDQLPTRFPSIEGFADGRFSGDGGPATEAELHMPSGVAIGADDLVFVADSGNHRVRAVNRSRRPARIGTIEIPPGHIRTIAGTGEFGFSGDGGSALEATLAFPTELKVDSAGNLLVIDTFNHRLRRVDRATGRIETLAIGSLESLGTRASVGGWRLSLVGLGIGPNDDVVYTDRGERAIYRLTSAGDLEVMFADDSGEIGLGSVMVDATNEVLVADVYYNRVLAVRDEGVAFVAGGARAPENVPVNDAAFSILGPLAVDARGDLYIADAMHYAVRRLDRRTGTVRSFLGSGRLGTGGDGGPPNRAELVHPTDIFIDDTGIALVTDQYGNTLRAVAADASEVRTIAGLAGSGAAVESGRRADSGRLGGPLAVARHPRTGEIYVALQETHSIRRIDASGRIHTVAGTGAPGRTETTVAREAQLNWPAALAFDGSGALYVSDLLNNRIHVITPDGRIAPFAGTGAPGFSGDGGPALAAQLHYPGDLVFDCAGSLYVSDTNNHRVRRIQARAPHRIETVAGIGERGYSGDGGPATAARLSLPRGLAFGPKGLLYIVDSFNRRVRAVRLPEARVGNANAAIPGVPGARDCEMSQR